jgi:hypothetical protein
MTPSCVRYQSGVLSTPAILKGDFSMRPNRFMPTVALLALLLSALVISTSAEPPRVASAATDCTTFQETGHVVCDRFLQYWNEHGGLAQQGYPISDVLGEISDTDGKLYTVQYFERAVFEYHPENQPPTDVLLSLLGSFPYNSSYAAGAPAQIPNTSAGSRLFAETGKHLGGIFLQYWNSHGGLAQQGYPISDEFTEVSSLDGKPYQVQYFERAVFEYHPENPAPNNVLLSQLGTFRFQAKYASSAALPPPPVPVPPAIAAATPTPAANSKDVQAFARYIKQKYGRIGTYPLQFGDIYAHDNSAAWHIIDFYLSRSIPIPGGPSVADGDAWIHAVYDEAANNWPTDNFTIHVFYETYTWSPAFEAEGTCYDIIYLDPDQGWDVLEHVVGMSRLRGRA